jgi:hypothetical protein
MTTLAWDGRILAADQQATISGTRVRTKKLFKLPDGSWVAGCGSEQDVMIAIDYFKALLTDPETEKPEVENIGIVRVWPDGAVAHYEYGLVAMEIRDRVFAQGSGMDPAMAMLRSGFDAVRAVEVAMQVDCKSGMGIDWINVITGECGTKRFEVTEAPSAVTEDRGLTPSIGSTLCDVDAPGPQLVLNGVREPTIREIVHAYYAERHRPTAGAHYFLAQQNEALNAALADRADGSS